jgi:hypothetical protein
MVLQYNLIRRHSVAKPTNQRGRPDRRGLWAESDTIAEQFVPSERYKAQQRMIAQTLTAAGLSPEQIERMLFVPLVSPVGETLEDEKPEDEELEHP